MAGGFAARFVLEVAFLVLLAVAAALADLSAGWIAGLMAVGWVLVALVEWLAWRSESEAASPGLPAAGEEEPVAAEESISWDIHEILAPPPDVEPGSESATAMIPAEDAREEP